MLLCQVIYSSRLPRKCYHFYITMALMYVGFMKTDIDLDYCYCWQKTWDWKSNYLFSNMFLQEAISLLWYFGQISWETVKLLSYSKILKYGYKLNTRVNSQRKYNVSCQRNKLDSHLLLLIISFLQYRLAWKCCCSLIFRYF
jgi:hypothetical protein